MLYSVDPYYNTNVFYFSKLNLHRYCRSCNLDGNDLQKPGKIFDGTVYNKGLNIKSSEG